MTTTPALPSSPRKGKSPLWVRYLGGGLFGLIAGFAGMNLFDAAIGSDGPAADLSWAQYLAITLGLIAAVVGLIIAVMSVSRRMYESENWTPESDAEEHARMAPQLRLAAIAMIGMAVELIALAIPPKPELAPYVITAVVLALAVQLWAGWRLWRSQDELERSVSLRASTISLGAIMALLSLWVPLAIYGLLAFDPLAVLLLVTLAMLLPTVWVTAKSGIAD